MEQPPEYVAQGENKVCHLKKAIYDLKQSRRERFEKFCITISGISFHDVTRITMSLFDAKSLVL